LLYHYTVRVHLLPFTGSGEILQEQGALDSLGLLQPGSLLGVILTQARNSYSYGIPRGIAQGGLQRNSEKDGLREGQALCLCVH
jgi:hypothetical protein